MPARVTAAPIKSQRSGINAVPQPHPNHGDRNIHASVSRVGSSGDLRGCKVKSHAKAAQLKPAAAIREWNHRSTGTGDLYHATPQTRKFRPEATL